MNKIFPILFRFLFCILFFHVFSIPSSAFAKEDSLVLKNGDKIVGEIKSLDKGVLTVETKYSDKDFLIEWTGVSEIYCNTRFLITLKDGQRLNGIFHTIVGKKTVQISGISSHKDSAMLSIESKLMDIVYLKGLKSDFWSRAEASVDLGFNLTRANNLRQLTGGIKLGYLADKWAWDVFYHDLRSKQDSVNQTRRTEAGTSFNYYLQHDWFLSSSLNFLANTEQALKLRTTGKFGAGKYFIHTNKKYWGAGGGLSLNNENFANETPNRSSLEAYFGSELNLFDIGDLTLFNSVYVYPSLTEKGRVRSDFKLDLKYEFLKDFYIKFNTTINFDNRPAIVGRETDYILGFSVGWEL